MITLIHGDDISSSRNYYKQLQKKNTASFDGEKVTNEDIAKALQSDGLFTDEKNVYIENFLTKRKPSKELDEIIEKLTAFEKSATILLWESKLLSKKHTNYFAKATVKEFALPKSLFSFLDSLKPNNTQSMLTLYHETLAHTEAEMILVMLIRQIRILLALSDDSGNDTIDEVKRLAPWQQKKLITQSNSFSQKQLLALYEKLYAIEVKSKTGGLSLPVAQTIDFLLATI